MAHKRQSWQHPAIGQETVEVECMIPEFVPELCDGWEQAVDLDAPAYEDGDRIVLPGFDGTCPECGDASFRVEGREMVFNV